MILKINKMINNNKNIVSNFSYLTVLQVINMLAPLLIYPYLIRVLGVYNYGSLAYHQGIIAFFAIIINYGFYITGAKDVAQVRDNNENLKNVISNIMFIKLLLWCSCFSVVFIAAYLFEFNGIDNTLLILCFFSTFYELLFVQWFFQGVENLKPISVLNGISKLLNIVLVFIFIRTSDDLYTVPIIIALVNFSTGSLAIFAMLKMYKIKLNVPEINSVKLYLKSSTTIFISNFVISIKDRASSILIGNYLGMESVAVFDLAVRILNISSLPITILSDSLFSKASREKSKSLLKKILILTLCFSITILAFNQLFMELIIKVLSGVSFLQYIIVFHVFICVLPVTTISLIMSRFGLIVFNENKIYMNIMSATVLLYIVCCLAGYIFGMLGSLYFYLVLSIACYTFECALRVYFVRKLGLL